MSSERNTDQEEGKIEKRRSVVRGLIKVNIYVAVLAVLFFLCAGRPDLTPAWIYFVIILLNSAIVSLKMDPALIAERSGIGKDAKRWDILPAILMGRLGPLAVLIVAGLDARFAWSAPPALSLQIIAWAAAISGLLFTDWAVISNKFFSAVVRIQKERGHTVVAAGPYRYLRHPGYAGTIPYMAATPVILGSLWAFIPAVLTVLVTFIRTALEDRALQKELDGYRGYAERVRFRLLPGIW